MEHFSDQVWADFVRETGNSESGEPLKAHLASGCPECMAARDLWSQMRAFAETEERYAVPENAVRLLKLEFARQYSQKSPQAGFADLVFDSLAQSVPAGVRTGITAARQVVYEADGLTVDLRFEKSHQAQKICAVGQVLDKHVPEAAVGNGAAVMLWTAQGLPVLQTTPNEHGEFEFEFVNEDNMRLSIEMHGRSPMRINLPELK